MSNPKLGSLEIHCDAPTYEIVWACEDVGFRSPLDVRWCRLSTFLEQRPDWWHLLWREPWKVFGSRGPAGKPHCSCGHELPEMERVDFAYPYGKHTQYLLGQCPCCLTMFWEEP
jgi:hypothetical protein